MDSAEVSMACMCANRSCPACWCPDAQLADAKACQYRKAADAFAKLDACREELLDKEDNILRGKGKNVLAFEQRSSTSCYLATHGDQYPYLNSSCHVLRMNCTSGITTHT
jgi:hypothetical protein